MIYQQVESVSFGEISRHVGATPHSETAPLYQTVRPHSVRLIFRIIGVQPTYRQLNWFQGTPSVL